MFSLSLHQACRRAFALVVVSLLASAPARAQQPQHAGHDTTMSNMPGMKMGAPTKKKKPATPSKRTAAPAGKKKAASTSRATTRSTAKKASPTRARSAPPKSAKAKAPAMPGMRMDAHPAGAHADTAHAKMDMKKMPPATRDSAGMNMPGVPAAKEDSTHKDMPGMGRMPAMPNAHHDTTANPMSGMKPGMNMPGMHHTTEDMMIGPAGVSMERMGSGTTWIPDAVTLPNRRRMLGDWMIMAHGFAFLQYDNQSGERGDDQFGSLNWLMLMATHDAHGGRFQARTMLSLDPFTVTNRGYPLLLQSGESFNGEPLHDRQHPHDFWMELGALYQHTITKSLAWSFYAAPSGEPALSPVAFMHRPSAMDNPTAPIGHHWQDATHVSFGVLTAGLFTHTWQLEGSAFNGREPDEHRWNFDPIRLDSYSGRVTINPSKHWSLAAGYGYLKSPEAGNPTESVHRITSSVQHGTAIGADGQIATSFIWGANKSSLSPSLSNSFLLESEAILDRSNTLFGRTELVQKSAEELVVADPVTIGGGVSLPGLPPAQRFNVGTAQLGYIREIARTHWATLGLGAAGTLNFVPSPLEPYYGSKTPVGAFLFLRLRPFHTPRKAMADMGEMKMGPSHE